MCKCCCENDFFKSYIDEQNERREKERAHQEYVSRNLPIILDLVSKYNEAIAKDAHSAKDADALSKYRESLAYQIVKYTTY